MHKKKILHNNFTGQFKELKKEKKNE